VLKESLAKANPLTKILGSLKSGASKVLPYVAPVLKVASKVAVPVIIGSAVIDLIASVIKDRNAESLANSVVRLAPGVLEKAAEYEVNKAATANKELVQQQVTNFLGGVDLTPRVIYSNPVTIIQQATENADAMKDWAGFWALLSTQAAAEAAKHYAPGLVPGTEFNPGLTPAPHVGVNFSASEVEARLAEQLKLLLAPYAETSPIPASSGVTEVPPRGFEASGYAPKSRPPEKGKLKIVPKLKFVPPKVPKLPTHEKTPDKSPKQYGKSDCVRLIDEFQERKGRLPKANEIPDSCRVYLTDTAETVTDLDPTQSKEE